MPDHAADRGLVKFEDFDEFPQSTGFSGPINRMCAGLCPCRTCSLTIHSKARIECDSESPDNRAVPSSKLARLKSRTLTVSPDSA